MKRKTEMIFVFSILISLILILLILIYLFDNTVLIACPQDAKICPDGSIVARKGPNCEFEKCHENPDLKEHFCTLESRNAEFCIEIYQPVCGWNDPEKIQCIKYPCASTYGNSCLACQNPDVLYYTDGECPS